MITKRIQLLCLSCLLFFGMSCNKNEPKSTASTGKTDTSKKLELKTKPAFPGDQIAVTWDGGQLYISDIDKILYGQFKVSQRLATIPTLSTESLSAERKRILDALLDRYMMMLEAYSQGMAFSPAEKEDVIRQIKSMFNSEEEYKKNLEISGQKEEDFVNAMSSHFLVDKCLRAQQEKLKKEITPEMLKTYYDQNVSLFTTIHRSEFNEFVVQAANGRSMEESRVLAQKFHDEIQENMDQVKTFDEKRKCIQETAFQNSDGKSAKYNYGYVTLYHNEKALEGYTKEFTDKLKNAPKGTLSDVIQNYDGYIFFFVKEQVPSITHDFNSETVQKMVPNMLLEKKMKEWKQGLREKFHCKINDIILSSMKYSGRRLNL